MDSALDEDEETFLLGLEDDKLTRKWQHSSKAQDEDDAQVPHRFSFFFFLLFSQHQQNQNLGLCVSLLQ
jgi:hypothetical protein